MNQSHRLVPKYQKVNTRITGVPKREKKEKDQKIFKYIMPNNFPNLVQDKILKDSRKFREPLVE